MSLNVKSALVKGKKIYTSIYVCIGLVLKCEISIENGYKEVEQQEPCLATLLKVKHVLYLFHGASLGFVIMQNVECLGLDMSEFVQLNLPFTFLCVCLV